MEKLLENGVVDDISNYSNETYRKNDRDAKIYTFSAKIELTTWWKLWLYI